MFPLPEAAPIAIGNFAAALILLGLGWNFAFIGATTMVAACYRSAERSKVQAVNDFAIFITVAVASLLSGKLLAGFGWNAVSYALAFLSLLWQAGLWRRGKEKQA